MLSVILHSSSCSSDPIRYDLKQFYNKSAKDVIELCNEVKDSAAEAVNLPEVFDLRDRLEEESLPVIKSARSGLNRFEPKSAEVTKLHDSLASVAELYERAVETLIDSVNNGDSDQYVSGRDFLNVANESFRRFKDELRDFADEHNFEIRNNIV